MKTLSFTFIVILCSLIANAQSSWTLSNTGIQQGFNVTDFTTDQNGDILAIGTTIVTTPAYTSTPAIYKSTDNGSNWSIVNTTGLTNHNYLYNGICSVNGALLLSTANNSQDYAVYKSTNNGSSWTLSNTGIQQGFNVTDFTTDQNGDILAIGTTIVTTPAYTSTPAIYKSTDNGSNWSIVNTTGLTNHNYLYNGICSVNGALLLSTANNSQDYVIYRSQTITGIIEDYRNENIYISINPINNFIQIEFKNPYHNNQSEAIIADIHGRTLVRTFFYGNTSKIDISNLPPNLYFIILKHNTLVTTRQFIKNE